MNNMTGWWSDKRFANIGDAYFDCSWAAQALTEDALKDGRLVFDNSLEGVMKAPSIETVIKIFTDLGLRPLFQSPPWRGDTAQRIFLINEDSCVGLWGNDGDLEGRVVTTNPEFFKKAQGILEESIGPKASAGRVYVLITTDEGPKIQSIGIASVPLERDNYNPDVLEDFDAVVSDLKSKNPSGRLAIFDGVPGTGKTFMIRGLLASVPDALFVLVPANLISELANPGMINALLETRRNKGDHATVFIVEDADDCLGSRDSSNVNAVSALLNLGDGIIGALMDIRLVCTTNLKNDELDEAVTRPGRLSRKIHVGPLDRKVAEALYEKLTGKKVKIDEKLTLAQVYSLAREDGWKPVVKTRRIGFGNSEPPSVIAELKNLGIDPSELDDEE
jgi:hypothetical protein